MPDQYRLLSVLAHPDDESMGMGGVLAKYAAEGVETYLITATRGQRGWFGPEAGYPGPQELGRKREAELYQAAQVLGIKAVELLEYMDGELDRVPRNELIARVADVIRRVRPQVVLTFDPNGYYGHPDHIAISQAATAAVLAAAGDNGAQGHSVSKLYYLAPLEITTRAYQAAFGDLVMCVDGVERGPRPWADWAITTQIDTSAYWRQAWQAVASHRSQLPGYQQLLGLPEEYHRDLWGS